jgi:hypothetical protein
MLARNASSALDPTRTILGFIWSTTWVQVKEIAVRQSLDNRQLGQRTQEDELMRDCVIGVFSHVEFVLLWVPVRDSKTILERSASDYNLSRKKNSLVKQAACRIRELNYSRGSQVPNPQSTAATNEQTSLVTSVRSEASKA